MPYLPEENRKQPLVVRIRPRDKALLVKMAGLENRTQTNMLETLIQQGE